MPEDVNSGNGENDPLPQRKRRIPSQYDGAHDAADMLDPDDTPDVVHQRFVSDIERFADTQRDPAGQTNEDEMVARLMHLMRERPDGYEDEVRELVLWLSAPVATPYVNALTLYAAMATSKKRLVHRVPQLQIALEMAREAASQTQDPELLTLIGIELANTMADPDAQMPEGRKKALDLLANLIVEVTGFETPNVEDLERLILQATEAIRRP